MAGWTGSEDEESLASLDRAVELGLQLLRHRVGVWRRAQRAAAREAVETASRASGSTRRRRFRRRIDDGRHGRSTRWTRCIRPNTSASTRRRASRTSGSRRSISSSSTSGATPGRTTTAGSARRRKLKEDGLVRAIGISINRWQPTNVLRALDTGLIDAVQVVYNVLDQNPEDELFPVCREHEHRRHRPRAVRRRQSDRHADRDIDLADGRFPEHLLPSREPASDARAD